MPIFPRLVSTLALGLCAMSLQAQTPTPTPTPAPTAPPRDPTFAEDAAFLAKHKETIILSSPDGQAKVAVVPAFQGRVMTSTNRGDSGPSFGFINRELIASGKLVPRINAFGGEDRFWMGPEGGQFAIFFPPGPLEGPYTLDTWQTPACIDSDAYKVVKQTADSVTFTHTAAFPNRSGTQFKVRIDRTVRLVDPTSAVNQLGFKFSKPPSATQTVAFETENTITNIGPAAWDEKSGLLSIWNLGMFRPSPQVTVVAPFRTGQDAPPGEAVNTSYFGQVPSDRVNIDKRSGHVYFRGDALLRTKIGITPAHALRKVGSWDAQRRVFTIVDYTLPPNAGSLPYVNSMWEQQTKPFAGDAFNSYNHGELGPDGKPRNGFYELETSSPAFALKPGESATHTHRTIHITGDRSAVDAFCKSALNTDLDTIERALPVKP